MPDSHFTASFKVHGDYNAVIDAWNAFVTAGIQGAVISGSVLTQVNTVGAPTTESEGEGYDVTVTPPSFTRQAGVVYTLKYSDDDGETYSDVGYDVDPGVPVVHPNGYHPGRKYSIFADLLPGSLSTALP